MTIPIHAKTHVLPGHMVVLSTPELNEGEAVEVHVFPLGAEKVEPRNDDVIAFIDSLPPGPRSGQSWDEVEKRYRQERDAWDL